MLNWESPEKSKNQNVVGLWIASPEKRGYLVNWFGRLNIGESHFIPLSDGLNVIYGKNGSGKSQVLSAISNASEYRCSTTEGLIFKRVHDNKFQGFFNSPESLLKAYKDKEDWLDYQLYNSQTGFNPYKIKDDHEPIVMAIFHEFLQASTFLETRAADWNLSTVCGELTDIKEVQQIVWVPVLMPGVEAPVTRFWANQIRDSLFQLAADFGPKVLELQNHRGPATPEHGDWEFSIEETLRRWANDWSWNPLINFRNFPDIFEYEWVADLLGINDFDLENSSLLNSNGEDLLYIPSLLAKGVEDFEDFDSPISISDSLTLINPDTSSKVLTDEEHIDINFSLREDFVEVQKELRNKANERIDSLSRMLSFLPNFQKLNWEAISGLGGQLSYKSDMYGIWVQLFLGSKTNRVTRIPINNLSATEKRWLGIARSTPVSGREIWILIDEPESGLHRTAVSKMAQSISSEEWKSRGPIVVTTHSPELLNVGDNVIHIIDGKANQFGVLDANLLETMGLRSVDLLINLRSILLVEGEHEKIIFENLLGEELRRVGCEVIVARGGKNMKEAFDSQFLFKFTDAKVVCLLDNMDAAKVNDVWAKACDIAKTDIPAANQFIRNSLPRSESGENRFMSEFMKLAIEKGVWDRTGVHSLEKPDILFYLDPAKFGLKKTWEQLQSEFNGDGGFKPWAKLKYSADFSEPTVRNAVHSLDEIPDEFGRLLQVLSEI